MSLWLERKDKEGKTHVYAIPLAPTVLVAVIGLLIAILLPLVQAIRAWLVG